MKLFSVCSIALFAILLGRILIAREHNLAPEDIPESEKVFTDSDYWAAKTEHVSVFEPPEEKQKEIKEPEWVPTDEQVKIIGRMANGIYKWKANVKDGKETARYYDCGKWYQGEEAKQRALLWAMKIVRFSDEASELNEVELNPWGVAGTTANESAFDLCSLGLHPRKAAYRTKTRGKLVLRPSRYTVSHSYEEVVQAIKDENLSKQFNAFDLGGLQVLTLYYEGPREHLLTWEGYFWQVRWMAKKQRVHKTQTPWAYWPGHYAEWKHKKVVNFARMIGATKMDIKL